MNNKNSDPLKGWVFKIHTSQDSKTTEIKALLHKIFCIILSTPTCKHVKIYD